ncbi:hypothetical protein LZQ00_08600 [Sphingobacterium sp. SRCM116780]|uniref:hypothetical protein n=1 Tax=Sphingobacterium sp. SRCM116780 TaxID=2907623 RepID=UPI001F3933AC|nr:hypothetical protein [Sphingobacterium sp. SRCM116780]UIR57865.1 hypothetical protein LZQ00_08600 [Sphingobacterium sp. SRCM116780]
MENSTKIALLASLFVYISCGNNLKECQDCTTNKDSLIFIDKDDEVYVRLKAKDRHPMKQEKLKANNYYEFYNFVYIYSLDKEVRVKDIIDQKSFKIINSSYFEDDKFIYFSPTLPGDHFNLLDKKEYVKFSKDKYTVYSRYGTFHLGDPIEARNIK